MRIEAYGEDATFIDLDIEHAPDRAGRTHALATALRAACPSADVIVGAGTVVAVGISPAEARRIATSPQPPATRTEPQSHEIRAVYDGPDLAAVAETLGITPSEAVARHTGTPYVVELVGFLPGFAYLSAPSGAPLVVPRRSTPRPKVPAGSIAVAASFTGVYPSASPGGWNLIGRAVDAVPFDVTREPAMLFAPGDRVRFTEVDAASIADTHRAASGRDDASTPGSASVGLVVVSAPALATVQDRGRLGQLGRGLPPAGPLDPITFDAANAAVGNVAGAAAIEVPLGSLEVEARGVDALVSIDGEPAVTLRDGERLRVPAAERAVRYLAVRGGIDVPVILGARATIPTVGIGGLAGRPLRRRDVLALGDAIAGAPSPSEPIADPDALDIDPGPHLDRFPGDAYATLLSTAWRVSRLGDRTGVRLDGARIPRDRPDLALPVPMIRGAVEVTTDGTPIILGPDHPTTGGYPVLAVLRRSALAALARKKPGDAVRFRAGR
ncbi:Allophanate hydrolase 2 subunit 1 [Minicystis rosea]|nr:Allophanate hydrolase 2 subunit 1 [Minicystis rosea]